MDYTETYFKVYRKLFTTGLWKNPIEFRLFFWIMGNAVYNVNGIDYGNVKVNRGQYLRSYRKLQEDLCYLDGRAIKIYSTATIKRAISKLIDLRFISVCETKYGTLFTILNYDNYQLNQNKNDVSLSNEIDENTQRETGYETNSKRQLNNTKKDNKDKYIYDHKFIEFWSLYPRKVSKKRAKSVFNSIKPDDELFDKILNSLKQHIQYDQWKKDNGQFIPHPATWLAQERWNDELTCTIDSQKPKVWNLDI